MGHPKNKPSGRRTECYVTVSDNGSQTWNFVSPGSESTWMLPRCFFTMR